MPADKPSFVDPDVGGVEDAPEWLKVIMRHHDAVFYEDQPDGLPIVDVPKPGKPSQYVPQKVTRNMRWAAERLVKTGEPPLRHALEFQVHQPRKSRRRKR